MAQKRLGKVLCYGVLGVDQLVQIVALPEQDGHTQVLQDEEFIGGESANTAVTLSGLGVDVVLMGNALGDDRQGGFFLQAMNQYPVDIRQVDVDLGVRTGHAIVLSDREGARSICGYFPDLRSRALIPSDLDGVALLTVDPFLGENAVLAAQLAREKEIPVFAIEVVPTHPLAQLSDVVINSAGFMRRHDMGSHAEVALGLLQAGVETVVITQGAKGCRVFLENGHSFEQPAYAIPVCDTTGAGDAFRAGLIYAYLNGWTLTRSVQFASGCAALTCNKLGGCGHVQGEGQVLRLITET